MTFDGQNQGGRKGPTLARFGHLDSTNFGQIGQSNLGQSNFGHPFWANPFLDLSWRVGAQKFCAFFSLCTPLVFSWNFGGV